MDTYNITIDNNKYEIPIQNIREFMSLDEKRFNSICTDKTITSIYNLPKEYFIYACFTYINDPKIYDKSLNKPKYVRRCNILGKYELVDFESLNRILEVDDYALNNISINEELKTKIVKSIPEELTLLEKSIYVYIKMCKLLTYDREYFALNQKYTKELSDITKISLSNPEVACFEFVAIYGSILATLGIKYSNYYGDKPNNYEQISPLNYGKKHAYTNLRINKFLVHGDSTKSILEGDLVNAKLNKELNGLTCLNKNRETAMYFQEIYNKVYGYIKHQSNQINSIDKYIINKNNLSITERFLILLNESQNNKLQGLDASAYLIHLKKILFSNEEMRSNIAINIVRNNNPLNYKKADILTIISFNPNSFYTDTNLTKYYIYYPNKIINESNYEIIQKMFTEKQLEYTRIPDICIPGIVEPGIMSCYRKKLIDK